MESNVKKYISFALTYLVVLAPAGAEDISENDTFRDQKTGRYVHVCKSEGDTLFVAESCGKYWDKYPRKRQELVKQITEYKNLKRYDEVMIPVKKDGEMKWALGTVSFLYEDGSITVSEMYSKPGPTPGSMNWTIPYEYISKQKSGTLLSEVGEVCAKEDFEILYGPAHKTSFKFQKGEKLKVREVFENGLVSVSYDGFFKNFFSYGKDNKLPVPQNKVEVCPASADLVHDGPRALKPISDEGAGSPPNRSSKSKDK